MGFRRVTALESPTCWGLPHHTLNKLGTPARANFELIGDGEGVHWPDIDEDISAEGMLYGVPAPRPMSARAVQPALALA
ncbi:MAG: DUF2442 domain-containing protein [Anaerolineae bacterium]|nr:DUF2442 domain-containing protein [Anaerolineae bacterium]